VKTVGHWGMLKGRPCTNFDMNGSMYVMHQLLLHLVGVGHPFSGEEFLLLRGALDKGS
jgi:hypothetical protein